MALTQRAIEDARDLIVSSREVINSYVVLLEQYKKYLNDNANYQRFVAGTDFGKNFNSAINKLLEISGGEVVESLENIHSDTLSFLARQEELDLNGQ